MARRVSFSGENLSLTDAALHHNDIGDALTLYFSIASPSYLVRFAGYKSDEVGDELRNRRRELDRSTTMSLLAAVEAAFRIDYLQRCYQKKKDDVSRQFLNIYKDKAAHASLENDILEVWKIQTIASAKLVGDLRGAFKFRHWMAHGRYWTPKLGKEYDYVSVYALAQQALGHFPLVSA